MTTYDFPNNEYTVDDEGVISLQCYLTEDWHELDDMVMHPLTYSDWLNNNIYERAITNNPTTTATPPISNRFTYVYRLVDTNYCNDCGRLFDQDHYEALTSITVCHRCADNYAYCYDCESHYPENDCCPSCDEYEREERNQLVHDYSYRPSPQFFIITRDGLPTINSYEPKLTAVTGFELEMEAHHCDSDEGAELAHSLYDGVAYLKHDGSLNDGFEMVTHPMTLDYINKTFNFDGLKQLSETGMRSANTTTCGLHVHINKGYFDNRATSLYRFMSMFYRNPEMWQKLAGRTRSSYANWDLYETDKMLGYAKSLKGKEVGTYNYDRYVAVNLQPRNTIELRFFKGTLRAETLKARLQAIHAVAEYSVFTRNIVSIRKASEWEAFREWTEKQGDKFASFNTYATEKGV